MDEFQKLPIVRIRRPDPYSEIQELQPDPANGGGFQVTEKGAAFFLKDALLSAQHLYLPSRAAGDGDCIYLISGSCHLIMQGPVLLT